MTHKEIARRLRDIVGLPPTQVPLALQRLAVELEQTPEPVTRPHADDIEALVRATQPSTSRAKITPLTIARQILRRRR